VTFVIYSRLALKCAWRSPPWAIHGRRGVDSIDCIGKVCQGHQFGIWRTFDKARTEKPRALLTNALLLHVFKRACINCLDEHGRRTHALMTNGTRCALFKKVLVASKRGHFFLAFAHTVCLCVLPLQAFALFFWLFSIQNYCYYSSFYSGYGNGGPIRGSN